MKKFVFLGLGYIGLPTAAVAAGHGYEVVGVGLTYEYDKRLIVGADFNLQKWGDVTYMNQPNAFCDAMKISVGAEYMPSRFSQSVRTPR